MMTLKSRIECFLRLEMLCDFHRVIDMLRKLTDSVSGFTELLPKSSGLS